MKPILREALVVVTASMIMAILLFGVTTFIKPKVPRVTVGIALPIPFGVWAFRRGAKYKKAKHP